ncbi:MAG TPA: mobile mystery protein B [Chlamydiales bacterium]|nr:mobile mystery protein B [Chlamydiales bacterium]
MKKIDFPEGATPLADYSGLKLPWIQILSDLNRAEAENIFSAQKRYLHRNVSSPEKWFNPGELKKIHRAMFHKVWEWAGGYRTMHTNIGIKPHLIPIELAIFSAEVRSWSQESYDLTILERAARIHHRLVSIHPFENGNGRFSRLIADRYLKAHQHPFPIWPSLENDGDIRSHYIQSLKYADSGNYEPLLQLISQFLTK